MAGPGHNLRGVATPCSRALPLLLVLLASAVFGADTLRQATPWPSGVGISDRIPDRPADWPLLKAQFSLRMQHATQQLSNNSEIRKVSRDIARVRTLMEETARKA